jgi:RHS repeat-associated protein
MDLPESLPRLGGMLATLLLVLARPADAAIGRTPGVATVTPDGEAAYSIPLTAPPGTNGMTPVISLEYRHRTVAGLLGVGWSIGGLSQITRCPRTLAQDGVSAPVSITAADRFCLDGQRLVVSNGLAYGAAGAEYRTEIETFARIRSFSGVGAGPQYFVVEAADGRIYEYGATPDSRIDWSSAAAHPVVMARLWALNRIRDRAGNVIDFVYAENVQNGSYRIASIRYNANPGAGIAASHQLAFAYEDRPSSEVDIAYVAGAPVRQVARLHRIDVLYNGALLRRYELAYEPALTGAGHSRLASVRECGAGGSDCLAPTVFDWQDGTDGLGSETSLAAAVVSAGYLPEHQLWNTADFNGDGRSDFAWAGGTSLSSATIRYRLGQPAGGFGPEVNTGIACPNGIGTPFDANGDGRDDLLTIPAARIWTVVPGTAGGLGAPQSTGIPVPAMLADFRGADMNGDGLGDIAVSELLDHYSNSLVVRVRHALAGGGFSATPQTLYAQSEGAGYETTEGGTFIGRPGQRIDLDGDGAEDLLLNENYTIARISAKEFAIDYFDGTFYGGIALDFNGDGCSDFAYMHYSGRPRLRIGGCGVPWSGPELLGPAGAGGPLFYALDWNGDGRDDLLMHGTANWRVAMSYGDSLPAVFDTGIPHNGATIAFGADVNGDGMRDLFSRAAGQFRLRLRAGTKPDLMLSATDGFGAAATYAYLPLTDATVYTRGGSAAYPEQDLQSGAQVVASLAVSDGSGTGSLRTVAYRYEGLRRQLLGRGLLGFASIVRTETTSGGPLETRMTRRQDYPFTGLPAAVVQRRPSGPLVSDTAYEWAALTLGTGPGARRYPHLARSTEHRHGVGGLHDGQRIATTVRTVNAIDATSGTITDETASITEVAGGVHAGSSLTLRTLLPALLNDTANWCLGRPRSLQLTASHTLPGGDAVTRSFSQDWDAQKCRPIEHRLEPGDSQWQVTYSLAYDAFGNPAGMTVTGAGMGARSSTIDWGARGQLPLRITDPLAQALQLEWDHGHGLPLAMTDPNGLAVRWTYDAMGEPAAQALPDGTRTTWSRSACDAGCDPRTRLRVTAQDLDNTGVVRVTTRMDADRSGRIFRTAAQQPGGGFAVTAADHDPHGRLLRQYLPFWDGGIPAGYWQFGYDLLGRPDRATLHSATGAVERSQSLRHDGHAATQTDALGRATTGTRTAWGRLAQVEDAAGNRSRYEYDAFGNLVKARDAMNNLVADIRYNGRGMKLQQTDPDLGTWVWTLNALGEATALRDARNQVIAFAYDSLGRLTSRSAPDGSSTWTWGSSPAKYEIGRLASVTGPGYTESLTYDAAGRPASRTIFADGSHRYDYSYNALGLLDTLTYPAAGSSGRLALSHEYDAGRLSRLTWLDRSSAALRKNPAGVIVTAWQRNAGDAAGRIIDESLGTAARVVTGFDPLTGAMEYRQAGPGGSAAAQNLEYAWDGNDNLVRRADLARGVIEEFDYDALDRLTRSRRNGAVNLGVDYDPLGNIRWKSDVCTGTAPCYAYDAVRKHAVTSAGGQAYVYDGNGNMTSRAGAAIAWTSDNLPRSIAQAGGNSSQFWYGPEGNRWKQVATQSGTAETTIYAGELMEKVTRGSTTTWRHYLMAPTGTASVQLRYSSGAQPTSRYLTKDHLGSIDRILDQYGNVVVAGSFGAFGERRRADGSAAMPAADLAIIGASTRDGFTGHEHLDNLGLIHMNGRVFDPALARFISADPYVTAPYDGQGLNRYAYVWNNPLSFVDPSGYDGQPPCMQDTQGRCSQVTVIGVSMARYRWFVGGAGFSQMDSGSQRNPCGQESSALTCAMQSGRLVSPASIVLTAGTRADPTLSRNSAVEWLQGAAARIGNIAIGSSPVAMLFGADPGFEWFTIPDSAAGRAGATFGDVGLLVGGVRSVARDMINEVPAEVSRVIRGRRNPLTIGRPGDVDAFVVAAEDIAGLNASQLARRLTIEPSDVFTVISFQTPGSGVASPVFRANPGFLQGGFTRGGAREFVIPNGPIPAGARIEIVGP